MEAVAALACTMSRAGSSYPECRVDLVTEVSVEILFDPSEVCIACGGASFQGTNMLK